MIISDMEEAEDNGVSATEEEIMESNFLFAKAIRKLLLSQNYNLTFFLNVYKGESEVIKFNSKRIFIK